MLDIVEEIDSFDQPLDFQCLHTMILFSTSLVDAESSDLLSMKLKSSPGDEGRERREANAEESSQEMIQNCTGIDIQRAHN